MWSAIVKGEPRTKKNSQRIAMKADGTRFLLQSRPYMEYESSALWQLKSRKPAAPIAVPINLRAVYYMKQKRRVDLLNLLEATADILQKSGIIEDDCYSIMESVDGSRVLIDRDHPRVEITITEVSE